MATLEARINALEQTATSTEAMTWLIVLTAFGEGDKPLTKLVDSQTDRVWGIREGETETEFTERIERDAFPDGGGVLLVTRG